MAPTIWQLISLAIIVLWTARLARAKGMNPLAWGAGSALLMAVGWLALSWGEGSGRNFVVFVGMGPLVFLLLFRSSLFRRGSSAATAAPARVTAAACPRCAAADPGGQNYCVHCGWDLSRPYAESVDGAETAAPAASPPEPAATVLETAADIPAATVTESPADIPAAAVAESAADIPAAAITETASKPAEATTEETAAAAIPIKPPAAPAAAPTLAQDTEPPPEPVETAPAAAPPTPAVRRSPTAANLTERGIALFGQGRVQEAIDQFTKAIALDPQYKLAWEQRAEAYGRLGRAEQQAADRRQLETI